jgi:hypothetical protein
VPPPGKVNRLTRAYPLRTLLVDDLISAGGEDMLAALCERADAGPLAERLGAEGLRQLEELGAAMIKEERGELAAAESAEALERYKTFVRSLR